MGIKIVEMLEKHVEKIVLAVVGVVCIWLLVTRVLISPNYVKYDNQKFSAGTIDNYIGRKAEVLKQKLNRPPKAAEGYDLRSDAFLDWLDSAVSAMYADLHIAIPDILEEAPIQAKYAIPEIPSVNDVSANHIRAVAYVPTEQVTAELSYENAKHEPNDIDLVTVEAAFDLPELYDRFEESFAGQAVPEDWRDPCLARPVFAAVDLQRQELLADGRWDKWQTVPRTKIDFHRSLFTMIEDARELPAGGIKVRLLQFDNPQVQADLLQPSAYQIASAEQEWFPPSLHKKYREYQEQAKAEERREARQQEQKDRDKERSSRRSRMSERRMRTGGGAMGGYGGMGAAGMPIGGGAGGGIGGPMGGGMTGRTARRPSVRRTQDDSNRHSRRDRLDEQDQQQRQERKEDSEPMSVSDIYAELDGLLLARMKIKDLSKMDDPLKFWAHDDTVEPEKSYRYRIRFGVFNPIAGTSQFRQADESLKNQVILWSNFSEPTEVVEIPGRLYFFPRQIQETAKTVTVQVSRYVLGYWYSKDFTVQKGEVIGRVEPKSEKMKQWQDEGVTIPDEIDYSTGAFMVDAVSVNDWSGGKNLRQRYYYDMLYSYDGMQIGRRPVKVRYWAEDLQAKYAEIQKAQKEEKQPLRAWGGKATGTRRLGTTPAGEAGQYEMMQQLMEIMGPIPRPGQGR